MKNIFIDKMLFEKLYFFQWIDVTDVSSGSYVLQVEVNPERAVEEKNYKNNIMECDLILNSREVRARNCRNNAWKFC